jgi:hypothetical protein
MTSDSAKIGRHAEGLNVLQLTTCINNHLAPNPVALVTHVLGRVALSSVPRPPRDRSSLIMSMGAAALLEFYDLQSDTL